MLNITGRGSITTCDGVTRRDFLQVGTLGAIGLSLAKLAQLQARHFRHEAGCAGGDSWTVQTHPHE
jgi:hypothetical protein